MTRTKTLRSLLLLLLHVLIVLGQVPDPALQKACTLFKQTVFEEKVSYSFFFANAPVSYESIDNCRGQSRPLIVGGEPAEPKEFPHMVRLGNRDSKNKTNWFCGGTLISNRLVLTAAHCLFTENGAVNVVRLGELDFDTDKDDADPEDFVVQNQTVHPNFKYPLLYNDIALLKLARPVNFNLYKHPACLPFEDGNRVENFIAIGWGHQKFAELPSKKLLKVQLKNFGNRCLESADFEELPDGYDTSTQLCIGSSEVKNTCNGDSGGPVLTFHKDYPCMYHVMGITSTGVGCDKPNLPSVYTRVHTYLDWIKQEMARTSSS